MELPPSLVGELVYLRPAVEADIPYIFRYLKDAQIRRFLTSVEDEATFAKIYRRDFIENPSGLAFVIARQPDFFPLGILLLERDPDGERFDVSFALGAKHRAKGYAADAIRTAATFALVEYGISTLDALVSIENERSLALLDGLGFDFVRSVLTDHPDPARRNFALLTLDVSRLRYARRKERNGQSPSEAAVTDGGDHG